MGRRGQTWGDVGTGLDWKPCAGMREQPSLLVAAAALTDTRLRQGRPEAAHTAAECRAL